MAGETDDPLMLEIMRHLEVDWEWTRHFDPDDKEGIAGARAAGRRAGRALKLKITTVASASKDGRVVVIVAINQEMDPVEKERMDQRALLLIDNALRELSNGRFDTE
ncbi:hypothetical protein [Kutzneria sp. CA-103260]|uniref:hypothetical protein n=1 Tax=Kutzneria sp. CA-103260 TaxID=2802641 RepID=UPI001BAB5A2B|nr:hypothetical protein [Kutzneria sp. CA-103260]QUQ68978.1 hypothetical protein JJ691_67320 [Kutzneria sp. CA-103260]